MQTFKRIFLNIIHLFILVALTLTSASASAAPSATQILDKAATVMTSSPSATVKFTMSGAATGSGSMTISREKFHFTAGDMTVWFDGKNQWALQKSAGEVNLTEPTNAELVESNPFALISSYKTTYNAKVVSSSSGIYTVELTAKQRHAQIRQATLTINAADYHLRTIDATLSDGKKLRVNVTSLNTGKALPASYFQFNTKSNPQVKLIDLR